MKKYMTMPDVKIVRFDTNDIIVTSSGEPRSLNGIYDSEDPTLAPGRNSLWE